MKRLRQAAIMLCSCCASACASVDLPDIDFMGQSDFSDDIAQLDQSYPGADETPDRPVDVRTAAEWDQTARDMQALYDLPEAPNTAPALTPEEFERQFERAREETGQYKQDDPQ
ncbi:MAG: hypothetical protein AAF311_12600 [Pseudomonadota bacterium]